MSLVGTLISLIQHQFSIDLTIGSILLGLGLLKINKTIRWFTLISLVVQIFMCAWVLYGLVRDVAPLGGGRLFSYILFDATANSMKSIMGLMIVILSLQLIYLVLPKTRHLFKVGHPD
ncbi:MAG TPA: hypothetical protein VGK03_03710 [Geothrix sp.]